jgi:uncharacterized phage infection (PIP) family protein YhgE
MSVFNVGSGFGNYNGYGEIGDGGRGGGYADVPSESWSKAIADAMATNNEVSQANGDSLSQCNKEAERLIKKTRQANELRAEVGNFIDLFPVPMGKEDNNPKLDDVQKILKERDDSQDQPVYDPAKLDKLNKMLKDFGMTPMSGQSKKSDFETLKTKLDGMRDEVSSMQSMISSKQGLIVGNINQLQTGLQGLIKASQNIGMGFMRIVGSV